MKYRIDAALLAGASAHRQREVEDALLDLNTDDDGHPPLLTVGRAADGGLALTLEHEDGAASTHELPYARLRPLNREYRDVITRIARSDLGGFGMRDFEALDYAKKLVHDEAGALLRKTLRPGAELPLDRARRLFTLVFLLSSELPEEVIRTHRRHGTPT